MMERKRLETAQGSIFYWYSKCGDTSVTMVFLHGLTADHTLFEKTNFSLLGTGQFIVLGCTRPRKIAAISRVLI